MTITKNNIKKPKQQQQNKRIVTHGGRVGIQTILNWVKGLSALSV
jgi:hypothetical protein